ncbi:MAG TPA: recombinase family protein [Bryobacteraceae bacterium]|nr:recombinase family protein [Bryobacteraceae bacterium]
MLHVGYYRVSTSQQGESGLGLAAQKEVVLRFIGNDPLLAEFTEVESGKRHKNRPQLLAALELCKKRKAKLVIAKLDRLSRNVAFIADLMESGVEFVCCDNPHATKLMLHLLAAFAQHERETISLRIREALSQAKRDLATHGYRVSKAGRTYHKLGGPKLAEARARAAELREKLHPAENTLALMRRLRAEGASLRDIAMHINAMDIRTPSGFRWYASSIQSALLRRATDARMDAMTLAHDEDVALERNDALTQPRNHGSAFTSHLSEGELPSIPAFSTPMAGRGVEKSGGMPMPSNIKEAERMLDLFTSVGARSFVVTKLDVEQKLIWGKTYSAVELRDKLPAMVRTAAARNPHKLASGETVMAGENLIVRPTGPDVVFVQLDDLSAEQLDRVRPAAFLMVATSPGNHQAWLAVSGVEKAESKGFIRRVRKAVGDVDKSASGAVRLAGTANFKVKYAPEYPTVGIVYGVPGRAMTAERLAELGLLAEAERPLATDINIGRKAPRRVSVNLGEIHPWPSYDICLLRSRKKKDGSPDRSHADLSYCMISITGGHSIEDTAAKLEEVSEKARKNVERGDIGYPLVTARNAAEFVDRNRGRSRA